MFSSRRAIPRTSTVVHARETERSPQGWVHVCSEATARRLVNGRIGHALLMTSASCKNSSRFNCSWRYSSAITSDRVRQRCSPAMRLQWRIICRALSLAPAMIRREEFSASPCRHSAAHAVLQLSSSPSARRMPFPLGRAYGSFGFWRRFVHDGILHRLAAAGFSGKARELKVPAPCK